MCFIIKQLAKLSCTTVVLVTDWAAKDLADWNQRNSSRERIKRSPIMTKYSRTPVTWTLKGNKKQFELVGNWVIGVNFNEILMKGKQILFVLSRFYGNVLMFEQILSSSTIRNIWRIRRRKYILILRFKGLMQLFTFLWWTFASLFSFCCHLFSEILQSVDFGFIGEKSSLYCNPFKNMCALRIPIK